VDQDPEISAQISLWNQRGSRVIRGNLIVIPMGSSFLYVEPLYLLAETSELPELSRVIVASGDRIAMRETLEEALVALIQAGPTVAEIVEEAAQEAAQEAAEDEGPAEGQEPAEGQVPAEGEVTSPTPTPRSAESPVMDEATQELIDAAGDHFEAAERAQRDGDWAAYGRELEALGEILQQLLEMSGGE